MLISFPLLEAAKAPPRHAVTPLNTSPTSHPPEPKVGIQCPECAGPVALSARCRTCVACGWSRCS